jgi:hypothetical protein
VCSDGTVVEVHESLDHKPGEDMYYTVGKINVADKSVTFKQSLRYDSGFEPAVALMDDMTVIEVHRSSTDCFLYYRLGTVDPAKSTIDFWSSSGIRYYETGDTPTVAVVNSDTIVETHCSGIYLFYGVGKLNRENKTIEWSDELSDCRSWNCSIAANLSGYLIQAFINPEAPTTIYNRAGYLSVP